MNLRLTIISILFLSLCLLFTFSLSVLASDYYRVDPSATVKVDEHGVCKMVSNNGSAPIFVPTKTVDEWANFRIYHPSNISLADCCVCSSGVCCDGCNYRGSSYICDSNYSSGYSCRFGTACGQDVWRWHTVRYCSDGSTSCIGAVSSKIWDYIQDNCTASEKCAEGDSTCNYDTCGCVNYCGDGNCRCGETSSSCPADCGAACSAYFNSATNQSCSQVCNRYGKTCRAISVVSTTNCNGGSWSTWYVNLWCVLSSGGGCGTVMSYDPVGPQWCNPLGGSPSEAMWTYCVCQ